MALNTPAHLPVVEYGAKFALRIIIYILLKYGNLRQRLFTRGRAF
jgi:hypothetical protein